MKAILCDLCGEQIKNENGIRFNFMRFLKTKPFLIKFYYLDSIGENQTDICISCFQKIEEFIKTKAKR